MKKKLGTSAQWVIGTLQKNRKGFGFVVPEKGDDIFVAWADMNGAMHGDLVKVRLFPQSKRRDAREGTVSQVLERKIIEIVGTFERNKRAGYVIPDDQKIGEDFYIPDKYFLDAERGDKVVVRITHYPQRKQNGEGKIIQIISRKGEAGGDIKSLVRSYGLTEVFPSKAEHAAEAMEQAGVTPSDYALREDLRQKLIFTIDGPDARDFDDAVSLTKEDDGTFKLGVHIADVSHYVQEHTPLDREAFRRGTSIYLMNLVVPMLPEGLSAGVCSLRPNEDRLTLTVEMTISQAGEVLSSHLYESVIRSKARLVYDHVSDWLEDGKPLPESIHPAVPEKLVEMKELSDLLTTRRMERGSIDFDLGEADIELDEAGIPVSVTLEERRCANRLIEEFMLLANEAVAKTYETKGLPFVYRIHGKPAPEKLEELEIFLSGIGLHLDRHGEQVRPEDLRKVLDQSIGESYERVVHTAVLRTMQKAVYDVSGSGHFGLALRYYCHFTSPIRRYPDLMIHRIIKKDLAGLMDTKARKQDRKRCDQVAVQATETERRAVELEREAEKMKKAEYMTYHIGETYTGVISGVGNFGIFVQLPNTVEGLLPMSGLKGDYYDYETASHRLVGRHKGGTYTLGDEITVKVAGADPGGRTVDFMMDGSGPGPRTMGQTRR